MRRKLLLAVLSFAMLLCAFALCISAAEPNVNGETVTLSDSTVLPIWDTDGDALIWYKSTANADDGYLNYDYVKAQASEVEYKTSWAGNINGVFANQVGTVTITVDGNTYGNGDIVVFNIKDEDVVVTSTNHGRQGKSVNCINSLFKNSKNIEYAYLKLDTTAIQAEAFSGASNLKYVNLEELTELTQIVSQNFSNCSSFMAGKTLDLSKTKLTTINSGTFNNTPIGELILPENLTTLASWSLQGLLKVKEIHIPETVTSFGDTMFKNCYELETVTGFKALFERGVLTSIPSATFLDCKALTSVDLPNSYESIGSHAFQGTAALSGTFVIPHECTTISKNAFHSTGLETIVLSPNITAIPEYAFCGSAVKYVYIPAGVTSIAKEAFRNVTNKMVVYYTGTDADYLKSITVNNYNGVILDKTSVYVSADEFDLENREAQHYVVYGYDNCAAFFGGHKLSENMEMQLTSYFEPIYFAGACLNSGCEFKGVDQSKTIGALFVDYGYSATEAPINGTYSMSQFYGINREALAQYRAINESFEFGFVVAANADPFGAVANGTLAEDKVFVTEEKFFAYDYAFISIGGITTETADKAVTFCMFVKDADAVYYLDGGKTVEAVAMKSYNEIVK